ncbi:transposase family protein [Spiroplasma ixodetis]|uniref:Transposase n=1 Tax=Spiroplasma ixodetis TaxID=2141 RepID=A0ABN7BV07_9MOLU
MMMNLVYWKEYYTFFQMSIKYKMSASSCFRNITWVENKLSDDKDYQFLKTKYKSKIEKKQEDLNEFQFYLIDSTEIEIERPTKKNYSYNIFLVKFECFEN